MTDTTKTTTQNDVPYQPTLRDMVMLQYPETVKISPGGRRVAIGVSTTNWKEDRFDRLCHAHDLVNGTTYPLHHTGSAEQMEWLDDQTLAVLKEGPDEDGEDQIWLYEGLTGDGWAVTDHKTGVEWFKPFAGGFLYRARHPERDEDKKRSGRFGKYTHVEQEESHSALYYVGLQEMREYQAQVKAASDEEAKLLVEPVIELSKLLEERPAICEFVPSPTGDAVYVNTRKREDLVYLRDTRSYCIRLDARAALAEHLRREKVKKAEKKQSEDLAEEDTTDEDDDAPQEKEDSSYLGRITPLLLPRAGWVAAVAPDGRRLLVAYQGRDDKFFTHFDLWMIDTEAALAAPDAQAFLAAMRNVSAAVDEEPLETYWVESGVYSAFPEGTRVELRRLAGDGEFARLDLGDVFPMPWMHFFDVSRAGQLVFLGANAHTFPEIYLAEPVGNGYQVKPITHFGQAVEGWELGTVETIRWTSRDGTEIEGVLRKPAGFDPTRTYPLVFVVHGGPRWFSAEFLFAGDELSYYPAVQFVHKGMLVLKPNYRGSIGRGQAFEDLNVNNLGIGDLWDLESAIDHLVALGWVDRERVGCMGWSQGGYISAFAGLRSAAFRAVSVGAGISDWYTYHISNDVPDFTVDYLGVSPFRSRDLYMKTAPISGIGQAKTPVLIQHGAKDRRVPLSNAMELYRGLKEMGVPVELFVFPGMAHPVTKPRENHAVMHQNLAWFSHYLLGEELKLE